ncbi:hypothetical protein GCM10022381_03130 [Leifsonia kafniensis]|uniref:ABC transporter permease n=1 Tax=Leifsonia kafniensis TaxID=475957 RepID=A0ABP7K1F0_9MICO
MSITADRHILGHARAVIASRAGAAASSEIGYTFYVIVLLVAIVAIPLLRALVLGLASPEVLGPITAPESSSVVGALAAGLAAAALLIGPTRGPVLPTPFLAEFLAASGLPRSATLRRSFLLTTGVVCALALAAAGIVVAARLVGAQVELVPAGIFVLGCVLFAPLLCVLWLIGQSSPRRVTVPAAVGILLTAVVASAGVDSILAVTPWGWLALLWHSLSAVADAPAWPIILLAFVPLTLLAVPRLLNALRGSELLTRSLRWQTVGTLVQTGDVAGAAGVFRSAPTRGRRLHIPLSRPLLLATVQRDVLSALRFPTRLALGSVGLVAAGWLVGLASVVPSGVHWLVALTGALLGYLAVGVWCDGIRHASENSGPASMYGGRDLPRIARHALTPGLAGVLLGSLGAAAASASGAPAGTAPFGTVWWWTLMALFLVLVRVFDSAKGMMPLSLLMPIVTPLGDLSILTVIAWQADAVLVVLVAAGGLTVLFGTSGLAAAVGVLAVAAAALVALTVRRIRMLGD